MGNQCLFLMSLSSPRSWVMLSRQACDHLHAHEILIYTTGIIAQITNKLLEFQMSKTKLNLSPNLLLTTVNVNGINIYPTVHAKTKQEPSFISPCPSFNLSINPVGSTSKINSFFPHLHCYATAPCNSFLSDFLLLYLSPSAASVNQIMSFPW